MDSSSEGSPIMEDDLQSSTVIGDLAITSPTSTLSFGDPRTRDLFAIISDDDADDEPDDDDVPNIESLQAQTPEKEEPLSSDTGTRLEALRHAAEGVGQLYSELKDGMHQDMANVRTSSDSTASSALGAPPPPEEYDDAPPVDASGGGEEYRDAYSDSLSHGMIRSVAAAVTDNLHSPSEVDGKGGGNSQSDDEDYDGDTAKEFDENIDNVLAGRSFREKRAAQSDQSEFANAATMMARAAADAGAESSREAHRLDRIRPRDPPSGSDVNFASAMAGEAMAVLQADLRDVLHPTQPGPPGPFVPPVPPVPPAPPAPPALPTRNTPSMSSSPTSTGKLSEIYKRAKHVVKNGEAPYFHESTKECDHLRRCGGNTEADRDLYDVAGLDPDHTDAPTLREMRRQFALRGGGDEAHCLGAGEWSVAEHVACQVLGRPALKLWYDVGVRRGQITQDRLIAQYQGEVDRLLQVVSKQKQTQRKETSSQPPANIVPQVGAVGKNGESGGTAPPSSIAQESSSSTEFVRSSRALLASELEAHGTIAALSDELHESKLRQRELEKEISEQRKMRKSLELQVAGLDEAAMAREDSLLLVERTHRARERDSLVATITEQRQKLAWYAENQTLLDEQIDTNRKQRDTISTLKLKVRKQLAQGEPTTTTTTTTIPENGTEEGPSESSLQTPSRSDASLRSALLQREKRIRALEGQLKRMSQQNGRVRAGGRDHMAALIEASRPSEVLEASLREANADKAALEIELEAARQESNLALRSLKQQFTRLQLQYKDAVEGIDSPHKGGFSSSSDQRQEKLRLNQAEGKIDQLQRALAKKGAYMDHRIKQEKDRCAKQIRAMKVQLDHRRSNSRLTNSEEVVPAIPAVNYDADPGDSMALLAKALQEALVEKGALEQDLKFAVSALEEERRIRFGPFGRNFDVSPEQNTAASKNLEQQGSDKKLEDTRNKSQEPEVELGSALHHAAARQRDSFDDVLKVENGRLRTKLEKAMEERNSAIKAAAEEKDRLEMEKHHWTSAIAELQKELQSLSPPPPPSSFSPTAAATATAESHQEVASLHLELERSKNMLIQAQKKARAASAAESNALEAADAATKRAAQASVQALQLRKDLDEGGADIAVLKRHRQLEERLGTLERRATEREAETTRIVDVARKQSDIEIMRLQALHSNELDDKDRRLLAFRAELDELLNTVRRVTAERKEASVPRWTK